MNRKTLLTAVIAGTLATGAIGGLALAKERQDAKTAQAVTMTNAKITMAQAIAAAEEASGGKTVGTGIEDQDGRVNFEVKVLKDGTNQKVLIDTQSGQVVKTVAAQNDGGDND